MLRVWALRTSPSKGFSVDFVSEPSMMDHSCGARAPAGLCTGRALAFFAEALCAEGFCAEGFCAEVGTLPTGCFGLAVLGLRWRIWPGDRSGGAAGSGTGNCVTGRNRRC